MGSGATLKAGRSWDLETTRKGCGAVRGKRRETRHLRLQEGRTEMPTEKFVKCCSAISSANFLPDLPIKIYITPYSKISWLSLLIYDLILEDVVPVFMISSIAFLSNHVGFTDSSECQSSVAQITRGVLLLIEGINMLNTRALHNTQT